MNKGIVLVVIFLFVVMSFTPIPGIQIDKNIILSSSRGNILYIGGSGEGNYTKIQDAIENASDGDTVFVYDDSSPYYESLTIDNSINLLGENRDTTVIDCRHYTNAIKIKTNWVNINGFTICNGSIQDLDGFSNIVISDNHFNNKDVNNFGCGITLFYVENIIINSNTFTDCDTSIIINECLKNVIISNNIFIFNSGTYLAECEIDIFEGEYITISNNSFINNNQNEYRTCMQIDFSDNNIIEGNEINGYENGIGIYCDYPNCNDNNLISYNKFINNYEGISIPGNYNKIINNNFIKNDFGCRLFYGKDNKIINNNFINNKKDASSTILPYGNIWDGNYWDEWIGLKHPILSFLPHFNYVLFGSFIDWHPANEPYNMTTTQDFDLL